MQQVHTAEAEIEITTPMLEREDGQTMAEYGLILTGIALVVMATTLLLGGAISATFQSIIDAL
ncbi:MAG: Flp family type IVb pilin [Dehalococcoidia bacterium]